MNKKLLKWAAILYLIGAVHMRIVGNTPNNEIQIKNQPEVETSSPVIVRDALDRWIDELASEYECAGCGDNFKHLDTNGKYSYGCLQFQEATFRGRVRDYRLLPAAEDGEILNWIFDCDFQKKVARKMIENEPNAYRHWYTSVVVRGHGYPPTI